MVIVLPLFAPIKFIEYAVIVRSVYVIRFGGVVLDLVGPKVIQIWWPRKRSGSS